MNVANLSLCKELYELSGWDETYHLHPDENSNAYKASPAYDLGYLLRKLPWNLEAPYGKYCSAHMYLNKQKSHYRVGYLFYSQYNQTANMPEDALCKLAIELFKQEILHA